MSFSSDEEMDVRGNDKHVDSDHNSSSGNIRYCISILINLRRKYHIFRGIGRPWKHPNKHESLDCVTSRLKTHQLCQACWNSLISNICGLIIRS